MKLLLDECLPVDLRLHISGHNVFTVTYMGWKGIKNGKLLALAANDRFDALITSDSAMASQQNLATLPVAIVVLHALSNDLDDLLPLVPALITTLTNLAPRSVAHVT